MLRSPPMACVARQLVLLLLALGAAGAAAPVQAEGPRQQSSRHSQQQRLQRERWFRRGRVPVAASTPAAVLLQRAQRQKVELKSAGISASSLSASSTDGAWAPLGPAPLLSNATGSLGDQDYGPVSGRVTAIAVDPNDLSGNTVYIGGANGGVWKSSNAAAIDPAAVTWTSLTDNEASLSTGAIAVYPGNSQVILVGTGEPNMALDSYYGLGILRSSDGGAHWTLISSANNGSVLFAGLGFSKIAFSSGSLVVAGASNFTFYPGSSSSGQGLYYSADAGATWHTATVKDGTATVAQNSITDVAYNPSAGKFFAAMAWHGIYSSSDGVNWSRLANQPGGTVLSTAACPPSGSSACPILRGEIAVRPGKNEMYVWYVSADPTYGDITDQGIWKTTDGGVTWTAISMARIENCGDFEGCGAEQGWYSLELAALPNASGTDLYAGATNIYKCTVNSTNPTCDSRPFLNLTHVYGCSPVGSLAHVHPYQHAISAQAGSSAAVMFFGNDGGVYRTLSSYGLTSGTCGGGANAFQSLNGTLGSLTSLVSLSQHPTQASTVLAGAQQNGSAATDLSHSGANGTTWIAVNGGEGGITAINPGSASQWFTANAGVSIQSCGKGINCLAQDFEVVVSGATLGGDAGAFSTPYILDPQAGSRMLVGTCRVWRGNSDGSDFTALSYNLDTWSDTACGGAEENLVSALTSGGTPVGAGGSPVVYAGTLAGRIFVTTNAEAGPESWYEATPPETGYPISSIVLDRADSTGKTAYAAVMGFGVPHVWKTTDGGLSWSDVSGDLPDAPTDSLLIDPDNHQLLYAGTDVGVFSTQNAGATNVAWQEVGTPTSLPNVPISQLAMFKSGTLKLLRVATYGRGAWQLVLSSPPPDYSISLNNPGLTLFPAQEGSFIGKLTAFNFYNSPVSVSCEGALPEVCSGETVTPTPIGAPFTVTARHNSVADFSFNIKGTGTDPDALAHSAAATLRVVDFGLGFAPGTQTPVSLTVNSGSNTDTLDMVVEAKGSFKGVISLSCSGLPSGANCHFLPSPAINFTSAGSTAVSMFISTVETTPNTTALPLTISATTAGAPAAKTLTLLLTVKNEPDYSVQVAPATLSAHPGDAALIARLTLTAVHNYAGTVLVSCGTSTLADLGCTLSSGTVYLTNVATGSVTLTLTVPQTATAGTHTLTVNTHDQSGSPAHAAYISLTVVSGFVLSASQATVTVQQGGTATYSLQISPLGGAFNDPITFTCTGLPPNTTSSFQPSRVIPGSGTSAVRLNVVTSTVLAAVPSRLNYPALWLVTLLPMGVLMASLGDRGRRARIVLGVACTALLLGLLLSGCGGGGATSSEPIVPPPNNSTPTGTYTLKVTASSGAAAQRVELTLIVQ
jgi:hypothetical protein